MSVRYHSLCSATVGRLEEPPWQVRADLRKEMEGERKGREILFVVFGFVAVGGKVRLWVLWTVQVEVGGGLVALNPTTHAKH